MSAGRKPKSAALQYLHEKYIGDDPERLDSLEEEFLNADIAQKIYDLRQEAKLTQAELAKKAGTTVAVICRLEDADYEGHSLTMLRRIATCLNKRIEVVLVDLEQEERAA